MKYVFALHILGLKDPFNTASTNPVVFTDGELPSTGLPSELSSATQYPIIQKLPGVAFTANPRNPVGSGTTFTVSLLDFEQGELGKVFLSDSSESYYLLDQSVLSDSATSIKVVCSDPPNLNSYNYINNECIKVTAVTANTDLSYTLTVARAQLNSIAKIHKLLPSSYSMGEDGSQDRIVMTPKPRLENGFHAKVYLFQLGQDGEIIDYSVTRVVTMENPIPSIEENGIYYNVSLKFIEDYLSELKIGGLFKEVKTSYNIIATEIGTVTKTKILSINGVNQVSIYTTTVAKSCFIKLNRKEAEEFFNEPLHQPSGQSIDSSLVSTLNTTIVSTYPDIAYQVKIKANGDEYIYRITQILGLSNQFVNIYLTYVDSSPDASILEPNQTTTGSGAILKEGWTRATAPNKPFSPDSAPTVSLRVNITDTPVKAFLKLAVSKYGTSSETYDKLIGGIGAGIPQSFLNVGTAPVDVYDVDGNTNELLKLDALLNTKYEYGFDLTTENSFKDRLTNEFILNLLLLGQLQNGQLTLKCWLHEVAPTVTLQPLNRIVSASNRLDDIKVVNLSSGINTIDLSPQFIRKVRFLSSDKVTQSNTQDIRIWRTGNKITEEDLTSGALDKFIRAFNSVIGGSPFVYVVPISAEDFFFDGLEFGDSVTWSDSKIPTPTGLGISGSFFIVGIDKNFDSGIINLKLLRNNLTENNAIAESTGVIAPSVTVDRVNPTGTANNFDLSVILDGATAFDPNSDFNGIFQDLITDVGLIKIQHFGHNPTTVGETVGALEGFGVINSYRFDGAETILNVTMNSSWARSNKVASDIIKAGSVIELPDRRTSDTNLQGVLIEPHANTLPKTNNYINVSPIKSLTRTLHTFS